MHIHKPLRTLKYGLKSSMLWNCEYLKLNYYLIKKKYMYLAYDRLHMTIPIAQKYLDKLFKRIHIINNLDLVKISLAILVRQS